MNNQSIVVKKRRLEMFLEDLVLNTMTFITIEVDFDYITFRTDKGYNRLMSVNSAIKTEVTVKAWDLVGDVKGTMGGEVVLVFRDGELFVQ